MSLLTEASKGCLMAVLRPVDAGKFVAWCDANIPPEVLAGNGYEREVHVTVLYGFNHDERTVEDLRAYLASQGPLTISLGTLSRFSNEEDVIKVEAQGEKLATLHYALRAFFGERVECTYPEYKGHLTLAYVKKGALPELDGNARFDGFTCVFDELVYSEPEGDRKTRIPLVAREEEASAPVAQLAVAESEKESFDDLLARIDRDRASRDLRVADRLEKSKGAKALRFRHPGDPTQFVLVTPDTEMPGHWRASRWDDRGPMGHTTYDTMDNAIRQFTGQRVDRYGPPWGDYDLETIRR